MRIAKFALTIVFAVAGLALLADQRAAADGGISLGDLAGVYSFTTPGSYSVCLDLSKTPPAVEDCGTKGAFALPQTYLAVGALTRDANGNSCGAWTEVSSSLPVDNTPPLVGLVHHAVGKISTYDPETGTGDFTFTGYQGGKCNGSTFDSTGATESDTNAAHFAVSNGGKRIDLVFTSAIVFAVPGTPGTDIIGDFSLSSIQLKQEK
jgi:hypothetical protein